MFSFLKGKKKSQKESLDNKDGNNNNNNNSNNDNNTSNNETDRNKIMQDCLLLQLPSHILKSVFELIHPSFLLSCVYVNSLFLLLLLIVVKMVCRRVSKLFDEYSNDSQLWTNHCRHIDNKFDPSKVLSSFLFLILF